jgi:hypothetical protein
MLYSLFFLKVTLHYSRTLHPGSNKSKISCHISHDQSSYGMSLEKIAYVHDGMHILTTDEVAYVNYGNS